MSRCKECDGRVTWKHSGGKWQCFNPDGSVHWDLCSKRKFERVKREGEFFQETTGGEITAEGYDSPRKLQYTMLRPAHSIRGKKYKGTCDCKTPPWERCPHSFPA